MYINELLDSYKNAKNYVQDKQIAHDLNISVQKLSGIRKGERYLTENEALFLADEVGADKEMILVYLAADKAKSHEAQKLWHSIAKKYNGLGLTTISSAYAVFMVSTDGLFNTISKFALCILC
ncbi:antirepressor [Vibrio galatheae]|uniref:Antirepressor n=1 Tax=Vibrio galatheae TaxID=579748 RepID=A0A0F4NH39_9VIBR|nr:DUF3693 domain-containing protein [Vibrio galatheae]KJY82417.1 antirepressor [Vibrio galatheae]